MCCLVRKTTKRLPYTVKCAEPVLAPEPPKVHMESKETFFLNTIPRRKATFDVQQEWLSEGLHAKRIELQKRDGVNYRYKTFGFAYWPVVHIDDWPVVLHALPDASRQQESLDILNHLIIFLVQQCRIVSVTAMCPMLAFSLMLLHRIFHTLHDKNLF